MAGGDFNGDADVDGGANESGEDPAVSLDEMRAFHATLDAASDGQICAIRKQIERIRAALVGTYGERYRGAAAIAGLLGEEPKEIRQISQPSTISLVLSLALCADLCEIVAVPEFALILPLSKMSLE